jgi:Flp pilus assembly protein TadG
MRQRNRGARPAAAAVEFAVLLPFLLYIAAISTDWARLLYYTLTLDACARNGALYASDVEAAGQSPYASVEAAALAEAPNLSPTPTVTSATTTDAAGNPAVAVTVTVDFTTLTNFPGVPHSQTLSRSVQMRVAPLSTK